MRSPKNNSAGALPLLISAEGAGVAEGAQIPSIERNAGCRNCGGIGGGKGGKKGCTDGVPALDVGLGIADQENAGVTALVGGQDDDKGANIGAHGIGVPALLGEQDGT